jgi:hypothetical protein
MGLILHCDGGLVEQPSQETLFSIELRSGQTGWHGLSRHRRQVFNSSWCGWRSAVSQQQLVNKDELFTIEDNHPQVRINLARQQEESISSSKVSFFIELLNMYFFRVVNCFVYDILSSRNQIYYLGANAGVDVSANQSELTDTETFQVEYDKKSGQWRIKACNNKYWSLQHAGGIQAVANNMYGYNSTS